jgi:hypothetical protein
MGYIPSENLFESGQRSDLVIDRVSGEALDSQMLLDPLEEQFDLATHLVEFPDISAGSRCYVILIVPFIAGPWRPQWYVICPPPACCV